MPVAKIDKKRPTDNMLVLNEYKLKLY